MTYTPSDSEKHGAAVVQLLAAVAYFVPGLIVEHGARRGRSSPYVVLWAKMSRCWSVMTFVALATAVGAGVFFGTAVPAVLVGVIHIMFSVMGAFSSVFNLSFHYLFIAEKFCPEELGEVYGGSVEKTHAEDLR